MALRPRKRIVPTRIFNRPRRVQQPKTAGKFMDTSLQGNRGNIKVRWWLSGSEPFKLKKLDETFFSETEFYTEVGGNSIGSRIQIEQEKQQSRKGRSISK